MANQENCSFLLFYDKTIPSLKEIKDAIETGTAEQKYEALKNVIIMHQNGEPQPKLLMPIIRYVLPSSNKSLKKLLLYYWEIIERTNIQTGKLKEELLLLCSHLQNDLQHPNEHIRGATLRFICRINEPELLEPLVTPIVTNLSNRFSYVRKFAVLAIHSIYKKFDFLIPDAPDLVYEMAEKESDPSTKKYALLFLIEAANEKGTKFLKAQLENLNKAGPSFQLVILTVIKKLIKKQPKKQSRFLKIIIDLLSKSNKNSVIFQAGLTLLSTNSSAQVILHVVTNFCKILGQVQSQENSVDSNLKLLVLNTIENLKTKFPAVMQETVPHLLNVLTLPSVQFELCFKNQMIDIVGSLINTRNYKSIIAALKKELKRSTETRLQSEKNVQQESTTAVQKEEAKYRKVIWKLMKKIYIKLGDQMEMEDVEKDIDHALQYLNDVSSAESMSFVKTIAGMNKSFREFLIKNLCKNLSKIKLPFVFNVSLWILSNYAETETELLDVFNSIIDNLNDFLPKNYKKFKKPANAQDKPAEEHQKKGEEKGKPKIASDGSYITEEGQSLIGDKYTSPVNLDEDSENLSLCTLISNGDFYLSTIVMASLVKVIFKMYRISSGNSTALSTSVFNQKKNLATVAIKSLRKVCSSVTATRKFVMDKTTHELINLHLKMISMFGSADEENLDNLESDNKEQEVEKENKEIKKVFEELFASFEAQSEKVFQDVLFAQKNKEIMEEEEEQKNRIVGPESLLQITQLKGKQLADTFDFEEEIEEPVTRSSLSQSESSSIARKKKKKIVELSGSFDPVYVEGKVTFGDDYNVILELFVENQTQDTLQNFTIELSTVGDLKICERPHPITLAARGSEKIKYNIKVSSTETAIIFGTVSYRVKSADHVIILNDVNLNVMDYIEGCKIDDNSFRNMWFEFEWENKIPISVANSKMTLKEFLEQISEITKMQCLTPEESFQYECPFVSANFCARSLFGEDCLANVSLEKLNEEGNIVGHVRIRSKTQGIALSLGNMLSTWVKNLGTRTKQA